MTDPTTSSLENRSRFLAERVHKAWEELSHALSLSGKDPGFSGILSLEDPELLPFLEKPGVFLIIGPTPDLPFLHVGAAQGPMGRNLWARLQPASFQGFVWRWEEVSDPAPTYAACIAFDEGWELIPSMKTLLVHGMGDFLPSRSPDPKAAPFL